MKITVTKTWETTTEVEVPDGLTNDQLMQHLDGAVGPVANGGHVWQWTTCTKADGEEIVVFD